MDREEREAMSAEIARMVRADLLLYGIPEDRVDELMAMATKLGEELRERGSGDA